MNEIGVHIAQIKKQVILPLYYHDDADICVQVAKALYSAGIRCIEFTNRGKNAAANFAELVLKRETLFPEMLLAVGTIKNRSDAETFLHAGADVLISPVFDAGILQAARAVNKLWIPGCMTATEINMAEQAGCSLIKLFPGNVLTPSFVEAVVPLFPNVNFVVTGGVDATQQSISTWLGAGACAAGLGSKLITKKILEQQDYALLLSATKALLQAVSQKP